MLPMIILKITHGFRSQPLSDKKPTTYAAGMNPIIYPPLPSAQTNPEAPFAYIGSQLPAIRYMAMALAPLRLPRTAPHNSTANVCPVIGTGVKGSGMVMRANIVVMITNDKTKTISRIRLYLNGFTGMRVSTKVKYFD